MKNLKSFLAATLVAATVLGFIPNASIDAKAANVTTTEQKLVIDEEDGLTEYKATGSSIVYITPGVYNKNVLKVVVDDDELKPKYVSCNKKLKYKLTYTKHYENKKSVYYYSFYTTTEKIFNFKFKVDGEQYSVKINSQKPVKEAKFGKAVLSTNADALGGYNYITDLKNGKVNIKMNGNYSLTSLQIGRYKNVKSGNSTKPVLYWEDIANKKKVKLSEEPQVTASGDGMHKEKSMISTTIIRVNYKNKKTGVVGYVDYYLNKIVDFDN